MRFSSIPFFLLSLTIFGCGENNDPLHRIMHTRLYTDASCTGRYFQLSDSGLYVFFNNGKELRLKSAKLIAIDENTGRIDQDFGESTLKIDISVKEGLVHASQPYLDPPIPDAVWKYKESTGSSSKEVLWAKILEASPPSITYPCSK